MCNHTVCNISTVLDCPENSVYQPIMSLDVSTCQNPDALYEVSQGTTEGCVCRTGFILDGGICISRENCGCIYEDDIYFEVS